MTDFLDKKEYSLLQWVYTDRMVAGDRLDTTDD